MGKSNVAINEYRKSLPIYNYKPIILSYLTENKVVIIHGGVASGKSTQVHLKKISCETLFARNHLRVTFSGTPIFDGKMSRS